MENSVLDFPGDIIQNLQFISVSEIFCRKNNHLYVKVEEKNNCSRRKSMFALTRFNITVSGAKVNSYIFYYYLFTSFLLIVSGQPCGFETFACKR